MVGTLASPLVTVIRVSQTHRLCQGVVGVQVVVCIGVLASRTAVTGKAEHSGSDRRPLCLSQGHRAEVQREDVGAGHERLFELRLL
jgi:hypothetical protein